MDMDAMRKFVAPEFVFGAGCGTLAGQYARNLGVRKVLLVTDATLFEQDWPHMVADSLQSEGIDFTVFKNISPNPRASEVMEGADLFREEKCDAIIAVGGGSPLDCAKAIGIVATNGRHVLEFEGADNVPRPGPPLICIPTTSGSAADISQFCIITDTARQVKIAIVSKAMVPDASLIDPTMTTSMPPDLTSHTGLDALTHAIEAYVSNASSPFTDLNALEAIRLVSKHLVRAIEYPDDLEARSGMSLASTHAGLAFSNAILGAVHAMAHSLGGLLDLPHGQCNAILLDHVMDYNFDTCPDRYYDIGASLGVELDDKMSYDEKKTRVLDAVRTLKRNAGVTGTLSDMGVAKSDLKKLAEHAMNDPCMLTNPKQVRSEELEKIYEKA